MYSIGEFANLVGVTQKTLRSWDRSGKLTPIKLESGHRRYTDDHLIKVKGISKKKISVIYCRESTRAQKSSLERQIERTMEFCVARGLSIDKIFSDYGSGLNYNRKGLLDLLKLITSNTIEELVIYHKDRLVRFGFEIFEELCRIHNVKLIVIDDASTTKTREQELADDVISIIHYFSMRIYGPRSYKEKVKAATDVIKLQNDHAEN